jgi:hypothetical protein
MDQSGSSLGRGSDVGRGGDRGRGRGGGRGSNGGSSVSGSTVGGAMGPPPPRYEGPSMNRGSLVPNRARGAGTSTARRAHYSTGEPRTRPGDVHTGIGLHDNSENHTSSGLGQSTLNSPTASAMMRIVGWHESGRGDTHRFLTTPMMNNSNAPHMEQNYSLMERDNNRTFNRQVDRIPAARNIILSELEAAASSRQQGSTGQDRNARRPDSSGSDSSVRSDSRRRR